MTQAKYNTDNCIFLQKVTKGYVLNMDFDTVIVSLWRCKQTSNTSTLMAWFCRTNKIYILW